MKIQATAALILACAPFQTGESETRYVSDREHRLHLAAPALLAELRKAVRFIKDAVVGRSANMCGWEIVDSACATVNKATNYEWDGVCSVVGLPPAAGGRRP
jgi:hypothetical protein